MNPSVKAPSSPVDLTAPILVTGASGFIGANLCRYLAARGYPVIAVAGTHNASWRLKEFQNLNPLIPTTSPSVRTLTLDLTQESEVRKLLRETRPSAIFNLAAYGAYSNQTEADQIYKVNFDTVRYLLDGARELCQKGKEGEFRAFVQAGSSSEYGLNCKAPKETDPTLPDSDYAVAKVAASALVQFYAHKHQVPAWSFRLYSVFGPFEDVSRLVIKLLLQARQGKLPPLVNPNISRDFIYVDDVGEAFLSVFKNADRLKKGGVYNIGAGECVTLEKLVQVVRETFGIQEQPQWGSMPNRHWDHPDWYSDPTKAKTELGWTARTSLVSGLRQTMKWIEENQDLLNEAFENSVVQTAKRPTGSSK